MYEFGRWLGWVLLIAAATVTPAGAEPPPDRPRVAPGLGARMDSLLERYAAFGYAGVALVEHRGRFVLHRAYGMADRERDVANRIDTRFAIASITKGFTAAAVLRLAERSALRTRDSLAQYFPGLPPDVARITIDQMLNHASGLPAEAEDQELDTRTPATTAASLRKVRLRYAPGTDRLYSNLAFNVLARIVEQVAAQPFERFVADSVIARAGLMQTGFPSAAGADGQRVARGYAGPVEALTATHPPHTDARLGSGSLVSTAGDLHRWLTALHEGRVVTQAAWQRMSSDSTGNTACGWSRGRTGWGTPAITSGGDWEGYHADIYWFPDDSVTVTLTTNVSPNAFRWNSAVIRGIMRIVRAREFALPPRVARSDSTALARYAGRYRFDSGATFDVSRKGAALFVGAAGQAAVNQLAWPGKAPPEALPRCNALADSFVVALAARDTTWIAPRCETPEMLQTLKDWWARVESAGGTLRGRTVLGTAPKGPAKLESFVRIETSRGDPVVVRLVWRSATLLLTAIGTGIPQPATTLFLPEGNDRFAAYDPPTDQVVRIAFESQGLSVLTAPGGAPVKAVRE
ncbi:MAG TPA: serine hydrolase domain-containing protein [Candidatus Eisenbacteria bacterium]|nr:serine hydrolase domain-containing protein [Candidatus Eisenbacteria bacterium]